MEPESNSVSFASQFIGCLTNVQLFLSHTSCARSRSNPTYSPVVSFLKPYGGNSASNPTMNFESSFEPELSPSPIALPMSFKSNADALPIKHRTTNIAPNIIASFFILNLQLF